MSTAAVAAYFHYEFEKEPSAEAKVIVVGFILFIHGIFLSRIFW